MPNGSMIKWTTEVALTIAVLTCAASCCMAQETNGGFVMHEETVLQRINIERLEEIGSIRETAVKCETLVLELREMLGKEVRELQRARGMLNMVATVVSRKKGSSHASLVDDLYICAKRTDAN